MRPMRARRPNCHFFAQAEFAVDRTGSRSLGAGDSTVDISAASLLLPLLVLQLYSSRPEDLVLATETLLSQPSLYNYLQGDIRFPDLSRIRSNSDITLPCVEPPRWTTAAQLRLRRSTCQY